MKVYASVANGVYKVADFDYEIVPMTASSFYGSLKDLGEDEVIGAEIFDYETDILERIQSEYGIADR